MPRKRLIGKHPLIIFLGVLTVICWIYSETNNDESIEKPNYGESISVTDTDWKEYLRTHPPRCLSGFDVVSTSLPEQRPSGHPSAEDMADIVGQYPNVTINAPEIFNPVFRLNCKCGEDEFLVHGYLWHNEHYKKDVFISPLRLECTSCQKKTDLFNAEIHGYDREIGFYPGPDDRQDQPNVFDCETCGRVPMQIFVQLEYTDDLFGDDIPEADGRQEDFFGWFSVFGLCSECSELQEVTNFECA